MQDNKPVEVVGLVGSARSILLSGLLGLLIAALSWYSNAPVLPSLVLFLNLFALSLYDIKSFRLPNLLTATLFIVGAVFAFTFPRFTPFDHIIGGLIGLLFFPVLNLGYKALRGRDGIGLGDAKLLAGAGIWLGWQGLPLVLLIGSLAGLSIGLVGMVAKGKKISETKIPFGPFLCLGIWITWLFF